MERTISVTIGNGCTVLSAPNNSLILLDEPEVSLHPSAQKKLKIFLLHKIREMK